MTIKFGNIPFEAQASAFKVIEQSSFDKLKTQSHPDELKVLVNRVRLAYISLYEEHEPATDDGE
ncbi:TPA: hypothetical protein ACF02O_004108 [Yersinia enterocolitica]